MGTFLGYSQRTMKKSPHHNDALAWTELSHAVAYSHRFFTFRTSVQRAADGHEGTFMLLDCPDWVNVAALEIDEEGNECLILVRQHRFGLGAQSLEFPGGIVDPGEDSLAAAKRELLEETGYEATRWIHLGSVNPNAAFMTNKTHSWLATGLKKVADLSLDECERLAVHHIPINELKRGLPNDFNDNGIMILTWHWFLAWRERMED